MHASDQSPRTSVLCTIQRRADNRHRSVGTHTLTVVLCSIGPKICWSLPYFDVHRLHIQVCCSMFFRPSFCRLCRLVLHSSVTAVISSYGSRFVAPPALQRLSMSAAVLADHCCCLTTGSSTRSAVLAPDVFLLSL